MIATQNPTDQLGTYPLPESQLDRFLMCITLGYPDQASERELPAGADRRYAIGRLRAVMTPAELLTAQRAVQAVHTSDALLDYLQALIQATRSGAWFVEGLSPRAGIAVLRAARARPCSAAATTSPRTTSSTCCRRPSRTGSFRSQAQAAAGASRCGPWSRQCRCREAAVTAAAIGASPAPCLRRSRGDNRGP